MYVWKILPIKQGLKRKKSKRRRHRRICLKDTSNKTRIETINSMKNKITTLCVWKILPIKQGLKHPDYPIALKKTIRYARFKINPGFQSLFYWKYLSDPITGIWYSPAIFLFQSLFYWKYLSDLVLLLLKRWYYTCFNPCFIGSIFQTDGSAKRMDVVRSVSILVLFEVSFRRIALLFYFSLN